jgi:hypothetical protein
MAEEAMPGPVDFVLIEFPTGASTTPTAEALAGLLDAGVVRLYDVVLIRKSADGRSDRVDLSGPLDGAGSGFEAFAGAQSGLFDDQDVAQAAQALEPGTAALLIAYENAWAVPFVTAAHGAGGQLVASERIPAQALIDALEAAEAAG